MSDTMTTVAETARLITEKMLDGRSIGDQQPSRWREDLKAGIQPALTSLINRYGTDLSDYGDVQIGIAFREGVSALATGNPLYLGNTVAYGQWLRRALADVDVSNVYPTPPANLEDAHHGTMVVLREWADGTNHTDLQADYSSVDETARRLMARSLWPDDACGTSGEGKDFLGAVMRYKRSREAGDRTSVTWRTGDLGKVLTDYAEGANCRRGQYVRLQREYTGERSRKPEGEEGPAFYFDLANEDGERVGVSHGYVPVWALEKVDSTNGVGGLYEVTAHQPLTSWCLIGQHVKVTRARGERVIYNGVPERAWYVVEVDDNGEPTGRYEENYVPQSTLKPWTPTATVEVPVEAPVEAPATPDPSEALRARLATMEQEFDLFGEMLLAEATRRGWCSEYEEFVEAVNRRTTVLRLQPRAADYTVTVRASVDIDYNGAELSGTVNVELSGITATGVDVDSESFTDSIDDDSVRSEVFNLLPGGWARNFEVTDWEVVDWSRE